MGNGDRESSTLKEHQTHCILCGIFTGMKKMAHMAKCHPEYKFKRKTSAKYGKNRSFYCCGFCPTELMSIKEMIVHQTSHHELELSTGIPTEIPGEPPLKETATLDNFFGALGSSLQELKTLREEKAAWEKERSELLRQVAEWEKKAKSWSEKVVELQLQLSKPEN